MAYAPESPLSPRRLAAIAAVVALHVGMLYALKNGLAHHVSELITGPLETKMIDEAPPEEKEPPPPPPKLEQPPPFVPPPDIAIDMPVETTTNTITVQSNAPVVAPPKPAAPVVKTPPRGDPRRPLSQPDYPPTARRLGQEGTVILLI